MTVFDPGRKWRSQGICQKLDSTDVEDHFFAGNAQVDRPPSAPTAAKWAAAKEICAMCRVQPECRRDTLGEEFGVWGGRDQHERYKERRKLSTKAKRWPEEDRLEWGRILAKMRDAGHITAEIYRRTGMGFHLASSLIEQWEGSQQKAEKASTVVDLPLPEIEERKALPFPGRPGERHLWARHNGMVTDCWYRGQTADGAWIYVETWAGAGRSVKKWVNAEDARVYHPQTVVIRNYVKRPDAPAA